MIDSPELRVRRMAAWGKDLLDPTTAGDRGDEARGTGNSRRRASQGRASRARIRRFATSAPRRWRISMIRRASTLWARPSSAGPKFRAYALAALAALDQPASHLKLRKLMDEPSIEVRYGAFNALRTLDSSDPFLGLVRVLDAPKDEDDDDEPPDSMALAIATLARRRRSVQDDPFALYVVDSEGPPLVHVSRTRRCEIVVFGRQQKLLTPVVLGTGPISLNAADNDEKLEISKIVPSRFGDADTKITSTLELAEVLRRLANLGAGYPEIVSVLETAQRQKNLAGELVVDAVPIASSSYLEAVLGKDITGKRDDAVKRTSGDIVTLRAAGSSDSSAASSTPPVKEPLSRQHELEAPATAHAARDAALARDAPGAGSDATTSNSRRHERQKRRFSSRRAGRQEATTAIERTDDDEPTCPETAAV